MPEDKKGLRDKKKFFRETGLNLPFIIPDNEKVTFYFLHASEE